MFLYNIAVLIFILILIFLASCSYEKTPAECTENSFLLARPKIAEIKKYDKNFKCIPLPEPENGRLFLEEGCFLGCIKTGKALHISGHGAENTMIVCNNEENQAVVEVTPDSELILENISLSGRVRCIFAADGSRTIVKRSFLSHCVKGGINICHDEAGCRADLTVVESFVGDIDEAPSGISYGISFGNGELNISKSMISGVNSFGVAVWGEVGALNRINMENSVISGVYGGLRSYEGHGFYAENSADIVIKNSSISDTATSFVYVSSDSGEINLKLIDFSAENMLETIEDQGGIIIDGKVKCDFEKVYIENRRGKGGFSIKFEDGRAVIF